jgi:hypothetical protein
VIVILPVSACCPGETSDCAALNSNTSNSFSFGFSGSGSNGFSGSGSNGNHSQTVLCACGVLDLFPAKKLFQLLLGTSGRPADQNATTVQIIGNGTKCPSVFPELENTLNNLLGMVRLGCMRIMLRYL